MLACSVCFAKRRQPLEKAPRADFRATHQNVILLLCPACALEVANKGIEITPLPNTGDQGVSNT